MMNSSEVQILENQKIALDTFSIKVEKPKGYKFIPGQFTSLSIDEINPDDKKGLFCFAGEVNSDYLEFIIKYHHNDNLLKKRIIESGAGDKLRIGKPQGNFSYRGMGTFIAAGSGIAPVLSIFRNLKLSKDLAGNKLIYSNKTTDDVIQHQELSEMLNINYINLFTQQRNRGFYFGRIDINFLRMHIIDTEQYFYLNGSYQFVHDINSILKKLNVPDSSIIIEEAISKMNRG